MIYSNVSATVNLHVVQVLGEVTDATAESKLNFQGLDGVEEERIETIGLMWDTVDIVSICSRVKTELPSAYTEVVDGDVTTIDVTLMSPIDDHVENIGTVESPVYEKVADIEVLETTTVIVDVMNELWASVACCCTEDMQHSYINWLGFPATNGNY